MDRIHGLTIRSTTPLPGLARVNTEVADVEFELVERLRPAVTARLRYRDGAPDDATSRVEISDDASGCVAFRYGDGTAINLLHHTRPASIQAVIAPGQTLEDLTAYLYGPVLGFLLRAWGRLALHASCVKIGDEAVLLAGPSGSGKSTTAAALAARGMSVLSDDLTALTTDNDGTLAWPAFNHLRLWPQSTALVLGHDAQLDRITPSWDKRRYPLSGKDFSAEPCRVSAIIVLEPRDDARDDARGDARDDGRDQVRDDAREKMPNVASQLIAPPRAVIELAALTYANYLLDSAMRATELLQLGALVRTVPVHSMTAPNGRDGLGHLCDAIERVAAQHSMPPE